jgi:uncharacterized phiE125 gp8 family phage protein
MKWTVTIPPTTEPLTWAEAKAQARIDSNDEQAWGEQAIKTVRSTAETEGGLSLITQTITAVAYNQQDLEPGTSLLRLPRGPVQAITSVTDGNSDTVSSADYQLERHGLYDYLLLRRAARYPLTVVYTAGYGTTAADIPPLLKGIMLAHFTFLFENRSADAEPVALDRIYRKYRSFGG